MKNVFKKVGICKKGKKLSTTLRIINESQYLVYCLVFTMLAYLGFIWLLYR